MRLMAMPSKFNPHALFVNSSNMLGGKGGGSEC
jgi:hypothetical protein